MLSALSSGFALRGLGAVFNLVAIPIIITTLGASKFAASSTLLGVAGYLAVGSAGLGSATAMMIAQSSHADKVDRNAVWQSVVSGLFSVMLVASVSIIFALVFASSLFIHLTEQIQYDLIRSYIYCLIAFSLSSIGSIFEGVYIGRLRMSYCNSVRLVAQIIAIGLVCTVVPFFPSILSVVFVMTFAPTASALWFIGRGYFEFPIPRGFKFHIEKSFEIMRQGYGFLVVSLTVMYYCGGVLPVFAASFGAEQLATASVMTKLTLLYCGVLAAVHIPMGAALKNAIASRDYKWVKRTLTCAAVGLALLALGATAVLVAVGDMLVTAWTHTHLPNLSAWMRPTATFLAVATWSYTWNYVSFATRGPYVVAVLGLTEIAISSLLFMTLNGILDPASMMYILAISMFFLTGTVVPYLVIGELARLREGSA